MGVREEHGVVIGRVHGELILIKTDGGYTTTVRVLPELGARLDLGQRVRVTLEKSGRPAALAPVRPAGVMTDGW